MDNELPRGEEPLNRDGNPKHPPGQRIATNWTVLDLGVQPIIELYDWSLNVSGLGDIPIMFSSTTSCLYLKLRMGRIFTSAYRGVA